MKNKTMKRISFIIALALVMAQVMALAIFADSEEYEWEVSIDGNTLFYDVAYERYESVYPLYPMAENIYIYDQDLFYAETIESNFFESNGIVWVDGGITEFYASKEGRALLDAFLGGDIGGFLLSEEDDVYYNAVIEKNTAAAILGAFDGENETVKVDVKSLESVTTYNILAVDKSSTVGYIYGALYYVSGEICYLDYTKLGNQYFDADGNFSYRSGEVELAVLDAALSGEVMKTVNSIEENYPYYDWEDTFEDPFDFGAFDDATAIVLFWICFILLGFIMPIPFLVVGLVFPRSKKKGEPKYWYALSIIAGVWMLLSAILLAVLLLI